MLAAAPLKLRVPPGVHLPPAVAALLPAVSQPQTRQRLPGSAERAGRPRARSPASTEVHPGRAIAGGCPSLGMKPQTLQEAGRGGTWVSREPLSLRRQEVPKTCHPVWFNTVKNISSYKEDMLGTQQTFKCKCFPPFLF